MPCCYFLRGCWKTCFRPLFCNNCWKREKLQCLGHKCFSEKLRCCWHMLAKFIGESLVPYFTCHTATFEGDVEKHVFSQFCNNCWKREKLQCLGHKCFFLKVAMLLTNVGKKLARVWFHTSPATLLLLKGMLKNMFFPVLQQLLKGKKCCDTLTASLPFATTAERKKCCDTLTASPPFCNNCWNEKMLWHSYSVTPTELNGHDLCFKHTTAFSAGTTFSVGVMAIQFKSHHHIPKNLTREKNGSRLPFGSCAHFGASTFQWPTHSSLLSNFDFCGLAGQWQPGRLDRSVWNRFA